VSRSLWQGANYDAGFLFLSFLFPFSSFDRLRSTLVNLTYRARDKLQSDSKVSATRGWKVALTKSRFARNEEGEEEARRIARGFLPFEL